jgi:hypothetical protein
MLCPTIKRSNLPQMKAAGAGAKAGSPFVIDNEDGSYEAGFVDGGGRLINDAGVASDRPANLTVDSRSARFLPRAVQPGGANVVIPVVGFNITVPFQVVAVEGQPFKATPGQATYEPIQAAAPVKVEPAKVDPVSPFRRPGTFGTDKQLVEDETNAPEPQGINRGEHQGIQNRPEVRPSRPEPGQESRRPSSSGGG